MTSLVLRLDKWLWYCRFYKSRSLAANYIKRTGVRINGIKTQKPSTLIEIGDVVIFFVMDELKVIKTLTLGSRRGSVLEARELFEDLSK